MKCIQLLTYAYSFWYEYVTVCSSIFVSFDILRQRCCLHYVTYAGFFFCGLIFVNLPNVWISWQTEERYAYQSVFLEVDVSYRR